MYKQIIVANKSLNMSPGKLGAMVAHGATSFFCEWFKRNVATSNETYNDYLISPNARVDKELFAQWISGSFTKIVLEAKDDVEMRAIIEKAHEYGMVNRKDFFNIVDESTEFLDVPQWAVIAFKPMEAEKIDPVTGRLNLYSEDIPNINDVFRLNYDNLFLITARNISNIEKYHNFWLYLVKDKSSVYSAPDKYRWMNLSYGTIFRQSFNTEEEAVKWLTRNRLWKVESVGENFNEIK